MAEAFLSIESMTHMKLQKLCYYAKAWYLAIYGENIITEPFEAWVSGAVQPLLYHKYKIYGLGYIFKNNTWEKIGVSVVKKMPAIAKYVFVGGALTLVADYIKMHHIDWLVMNGGFVGFNIAAYELDKFKGKKTVRTFNAFSLSNFKEVGLSGFFCVKK